MFEADAVRDILDLLSALLPPKPPERLGEMLEEVLDPLGFRVRRPAVAAMGADPLRGKVLEEPGRWRDARSDLWKLGVRRMPVDVLWPPTPSELSSDCIDPCIESAFRLTGRLPPADVMALAGAESLRRS